MLHCAQLGIPVEELTKKYELDFLESLDALRVGDHP